MQGSRPNDKAKVERRKEMKNRNALNQLLQLFRLSPSAFRLAIAALLVSCAAIAQEFPSKPVRVVVPFPAGGPNDLAIRPLTEKLPQLMGQPFIVDNRAGANGVIGTEFVAKSPPDGHTLLVISSS